MTLLWLEEDSPEYAVLLLQHVPELKLYCFRIGRYWAAMLRVKSAFGHWEPLPIWEIIIVGLVREE